MASLSDFLRWGVIRGREERRSTLRTLDDYGVRPAGDSERPLRALSGGNQQKVLIAKWLRLTHLQCVVLHEPVQGIDVGTKQHVFRLIRELASRGLAVVLVSAEHEDLARLCNRVLVLRNGRAERELAGDSASLGDILRACNGW